MFPARKIAQSDTPRKPHTFVSFFALLRFEVCCKCKDKKPRRRGDETKEMVRVAVGRTSRNNCFCAKKKKEKIRSTRVMEEKKGGWKRREKKSIDSVAEERFSASEIKMVVGNFECFIRRHASGS